MAATQSAQGRARLLALARRSDSATTELFAALANRDLGALLLRGPVIARRLYAEGGRSYHDTDLLVPEEGWLAVEEVLRSVGYAPYTALGHAQHWRRPADGAEIDVHRSLWGVRAPSATLWAAMTAHRAALELDGIEVPVPDPAGTAVVVALHAAQHGAVVTHTLVDLERALVRFDVDTWTEAVRLAEEIGCLAAFRQGISMLPAGLPRLAELGLEPAVSPQALLLRRGVRVPDYLLEPLTARERLGMVGRRVAPGRDEIAAFIDPRAATSTAWLAAAHARRYARLPARTIRMVVSWRQARTEAETFRGGSR